MSGVDVLAVMRRHAKAERERLGTMDNETQKALAVVSELIEAADDVAGELTVEPEPGTSFARLDAALARCQPAEIPEMTKAEEAAEVHKR